MTDLTLATPPAFFSDGNNTCDKWIHWIDKLELFFDASGITDKQRKYAMLLYCGGDNISRIFKTLNVQLRDDAGNLLREGTPEAEIDQYIKTRDALTQYFTPKRNLSFERNRFRTAHMLDNETSQQYVTRLRELSKYCAFDQYNIDAAIMEQYIVHCKSPKIRKMLLKEDNLTVEKLLACTSTEEISSEQAREMEKTPSSSYQEEDEALNIQTGKSKPFDASNRTKQFGKNNRNNQNKSNTQRTLFCYGCGSNQHLYMDPTCIARDKSCNFCGFTGHIQSVCRKKMTSNSNSNQRPSSRSNRQYNNKYNDINFADGTQPNTSNSTNTNSDEEEPEDYLFHLNDNSRQGRHKTVLVNIDNQNVTFIIDSGSTCNLIDKSTFENFKDRCKVYPPKTKVYVYGSKDPLDLIGVFYATLKVGNSKVVAPILISNVDNAGCILSEKTSTALGLLKVVCDNTSKPSGLQHTTAVNYTSTRTLQEEINPIIQEFKGILTGTGKLEGFQLKLNINTNVKPIAQHPRRIPFHIKEMAGKELQRLLKNDIIEQVNGPTTWCSPLVIAPTKTGGVRLCVDLRQANTAIMRTRHPIPTIDETLEKLTGATIFSKLDLKSGYHQIELEKSSRDITTFSSSLGLFQYKRLCFGISSASEEFQHIIGGLFANEPNICNISDDILIFGKNLEEHNNALRQCFRILQENSLTLNPNKCEFGKTELEFFGYIISGEGIRPTKEKIEAVQNYPPPTNIKQLRSFLGLINYLNRFIPNLADKSERLRRLIRKDIPWAWNTAEQACFDELKRLVTGETVMVHYNKDLKTRVVTDASPVGLGAMLLQQQTDGVWKVVTYISRSLSTVERNYSQTEREALAIVWACKKLHIFVYGCKFEIQTDHKPLIGIFKPNSQQSARLL